MNPRVKDPLYHFVISWKEGEHPDRDEAFGSVEYTLRNLGFDGHQFVAAIHRDTDNVHVHVMVNRVSPASLRVVTPSNDFYVLDRCMRELEIKYSRSHANGPYVVVERNGQKVVERAGAANGPRAKREPEGAEQMRVYAGTESLHAYMQGDARKALLAALKDPAATWQSLHLACERHGVSLQPKGRGLAFYAIGDAEVTPVKASDVHENLSLARLEKRFGTYEPPAEHLDAPPEARYSADAEAPTVEAKQPVSKRDPVKRQERREARAQARRDLKLRYQSYRSNFVVRRVDPADSKRRYAQLAQQARQERAAIRAAGGLAKHRKMHYSLLALKIAKAREQLVAQLAAERQSLRENPDNRPLSYEAWVARQAQAGDEAAVAQMRGWAYAQGRAGDGADAGSNATSQAGVAAASDSQPVAVIVLSHVAPHDVRRDGSIVYWHQNRRSFVDYGRAIRMVSQNDSDEDRIHAALLLARQKFGSTFRLTGTDEFKARAIEIMVKHGIGATLKDPDQEALRQQLLAAASKAAAPGASRSPRTP